MRKTPWTTYLWPGLPLFWSYGSWPGLALALGAAVLCNVLLVTTFGWSELVSPNWRITLWVVFVAAWIVASVWSVRRQRATGASDCDGFEEALDHYLRGDYYQAEQILDGLLRRNGRDLEARLMLATLLRRAGRPDEALEQLDVLSHLEGAGKWELEIADERERLEATLKAA